jgi:hypothetical protein
MQTLIFRPLAPLVLFSVALTTLLCISLIAGFAPSATFELVASVSWSLLVAFWVMSDARRRRCVPCYDFGMFCYVFLPWIVPWYCFWSRGRRGVLTLGTIVGLWLVPYVVAAVVWQMIYGS